jgi:hypothetical protein
MLIGLIAVVGLTAGCGSEDVVNSIAPTSTDSGNDDSTQLESCAFEDVAASAPSYAVRGSGGYFYNQTVLNIGTNAVLDFALFADGSGMYRFWTNYEQMGESGSQSPSTTVFEITENCELVFKDDATSAVRLRLENPVVSNGLITSVDIYDVNAAIQYTNQSVYLENPARW